MHRLGYTRAGNTRGAPLAIIHGWGCDSSCMMPLASMFPDRDIYLIDLPGYGKSRHLASIADDFSATNYLLLNTLPMGCDLMSWSFGSIYALRAISTLYNPCINISSFRSGILSNPNIRALDEFSAHHPLTTLQTPHTSVMQAALAAEQAVREHQGGSGSAACASIPVGQGPSCPVNLLAALSKSRPFIRSLVTVCGSPRFPSDPNWKGMSAVKVLKCNTKLNEHRMKRILNIFYRMIVSSPLQGECSCASQHAASFLKHRPNIPYEVLMAGIRMVTFIDERPSMEHLKVPSLHLFGRNDPLVPCSLGAYFEQYPNHSSFVFQHSSHSPMFTEPELFASVVTTFLENLDISELRSQSNQNEYNETGAMPGRNSPGTSPHNSASGGCGNSGGSSNDDCSA